MSNSPAVLRILERLDVVKEMKDGTLCRCPAHTDDSPSLLVSEGGDGRALVVCRAGCDTKAVLLAIGMTASDLFPPGSKSKDLGAKVGAVAQKPFGKPVATYEYFDENGVLLFQVLRDENKQFRQRRPTHREPPADLWTWNMDGVRKIVYHLPEIASAVALGFRIHIVEGEKDVETLRALGLVATCNPGGAGKWSEEHSKHLQGAAEVIIFPDNDEPGRRHARAVRDALRGKVGKVRIVNPPGVPEKGDVSDYVKAGADKATIEALVLAPPIMEGWVGGWTLLQKPLPDVEWLVPGMISRPCLAILSGDSGVFKSWTGIHIGLHLATQSDWFGKVRLNGRKVMYITADEDEAEVKRKMKFLCAGAPWGEDVLRSLDHTFLLWAGDLDFGDEASFSKLVDDISDWSPDVIMVDHLRVCFPGDENTSEFASLVKRRSKAITTAHPCGVVWYHHWNKPSKDRPNTPSSRMRGTGALRGICDHHFAIERSPEGVATLTVDKNRKGRELAPFSFVPHIRDEEGRAWLEWKGDAFDLSAETGATQAVVAALEAAKGGSLLLKDLIRDLGADFTERQVRFAVQNLEKVRKVLCAIEKGRKIVGLNVQQALGSSTPYAED